MAPVHPKESNIYSMTPAQPKESIHCSVIYIPWLLPSNREHIYILWLLPSPLRAYIYCNVMYSTTEIFTLFVKCRWKLSCILVQQEYAVSKLFCSDFPQTMTWSLSSWDPLLLHFYADCYDCDLCQKSNLLWSYKHHRNPPPPNPNPLRFLIIIFISNNAPKWIIVILMCQSS